MHFISVQIARFVDSQQPGWVECELVDAEGCRHIIIDKVPVFTSEALDGDSEFPRPGNVPCVVLKRYQDEKGRELVRVSTARPADIESQGGLSEFTVLPSVMTSVPD